ncbi:LysM peptidoglycan-binding domain-containing protein [Paenibacillus sp.]|uniref:LysM peptidoglycan-binding domain-containing protein n=1 Tax=Paenibacillus sp. TaxID=58172 RepID=UPI0028122955|nr:LysM peptidoglycan-binding domain-containing protein [Paenibacillus sp.]
MTEYHMSLSFNSQAEAIIFPVLPATLELKRKGGGKTYDIVGLGQVNVIHARELAEISFESVFPASRDPTVSSKLILDSPIGYVEYIIKWQDSRHPCRFIFQGSNLPINLPVSIEQFDRWEEGGSPGDIRFRLTLKEYVFHAPRKANAPAPRPDERVRPDTYTMLPGDTLRSVSRKLYGTSDRWRDIQTANGISDDQVYRLPVGFVLRLPKE